MGKAHIHQLVSKDHGLFQTDVSITGIDEARDRFFVHNLVDAFERQGLWHDVIEQGSTDCGIGQRGFFDNRTIFLNFVLFDANLHPGMYIYLATMVRTMYLVAVCKDHPLALGVHPLAGHVVDAEHDVLRRHDDRLPARWRENIVGRHHERPRFELCLERQRYVHRHLVTVKVRVVRGTDQRV